MIKYSAWCAALFLMFCLLFSHLAESLAHFSAVRLTNSEVLCAKFKVDPLRAPKSGRVEKITSSF